MATLLINGKSQTVDADPDTPLLWVIRERLRLTGTKFGCGVAQCGACTVHIDGQPKRSCITPTGSVGAAKVSTIESMAEHPIGKKVQAAWMELDVAQCGYCQSGQIMQAADLLARNPNPSDTDIVTAMSGNICRCMTYPRIKRAIKRAAQQGGA